MSEWDKGMKLTIYRKLLLSYLAMAFLTVLASAYAIFSLQQLNEIAYRIINDDFAVVDQSKSLLDSLIAQESAEKRYLILQDPTIEEIFWSRSREFNRIFEELRKGRFAGLDPKIARLSLLHSEYDALFFQEVQLVQAKRNEEAQVLSEGQGRKAIDEMAMLVRAVQKKAEENIDARMKRIDVQSLRASRLTVVLSLVSLVLGVLVVLLVTYNISRPLRRLEQATTMIAEGKFDFDFHLDRNDEIGSLSYAFGIMAQRLKILEERNLDASPLTGLPGNLAIERELGNRLQAKRPVSLCHVDLDNFKPFVDHYGYAWGERGDQGGRPAADRRAEGGGEEGGFPGPYRRRRFRAHFRAAARGADLPADRGRFRWPDPEILYGNGPGAGVLHRKGSARGSGRNSR